MWEVVKRNASSYPAYVDTVPLHAFIDDLGFSSIFQAIQQCKVDVKRMKCYVHGKRVVSVKELDDMLRYYEYPKTTSVSIYQLCTQNSLAYVCERGQALIPAHVHLGSGTRSHVVKILDGGRVMVGKTFRCFEIVDEGTVDTHFMKVQIEVDLAKEQVTMVFQLKPKVD